MPHINNKYQRNFSKLSSPPLSELQITLQTQSSSSSSTSVSSLSDLSPTSIADVENVVPPDNGASASNSMELTELAAGKVILIVLDLE